MNAQPWEPRLARLEGSFEQIDRRLGDLAAHVDARFAQVDARFAQVDARFDFLDQKIDNVREAVNGKLDGLQWRMTTLIVGTWITTIIAIIFHGR